MHNYGKFQYSLFEIFVPNHLPPPPTKPTQLEAIKNPTLFQMVPQIQSSNLKRESTLLPCVAFN